MSAFSPKAAVQNRRFRLSLMSAFGHKQPSPSSERKFKSLLEEGFTGRIRVPATQEVGVSLGVVYRRLYSSGFNLGLRRRGVGPVAQLA